MTMNETPRTTAATCTRCKLTIPAGQPHDADDCQSMLIERHQKNRD